MTDQKDQYRSVDKAFFSLPVGEMIAHSTDRDLFQVYPPEAAEVLPGCNEFRTLESHAREWIRKRQLRSFTQPGRSPVKKLQNYLAAKLIGSGVELPVPARQMREVQRRLELFVIDGFLISKQELGNHVSEKIAAVKPATASDTAIQTIGIPTRNRNDILRNCVATFLKAARGHDRPLAYHIMDDSDAAGGGGDDQEAEDGGGGSNVTVGRVPKAVGGKS